MADPIKVLQSLAAPLASQYAVFERDQVLTHIQLNEVSTYLDQQDRLTRISLFGVGIVTGLQPSSVDSQVCIAPGLGITTDGDLIRLTSPLVLTKVRTYDPSAPQYAPFFDPASKAMLDITELVGEGDPLGAALSGRPEALDGRVVLLLMESTLSDPDLCTGADCDNLGRESQHKLRVLLVRQEDAVWLGAGLAPASQRARMLPELQAFRPQVGADVTTAEILTQAYRTANAKTLNGIHEPPRPALHTTLMLRFATPGLSDGLAKLAETFPDLLIEAFGSDPTERWLKRLEQLGGQATASSVQTWFDCLKDLVCTWNEMREALLADETDPRPDPATFPKHLLAGAIGAPQTQRTPFFPSSALGPRACEAAADARFLLRRLGLLIDNYAPPADSVLRVTPSRGEETPLGDRAIPWYYLADVHAGWNRRLSDRQLGNQNLGYRASEYRGSNRALNPLAGAIAAYSFFRVEGHLGRPVADVLAELKALIAGRNLPFEAHAVLAHNQKDRIKIRPGIRYTDLHRFHYLLRRDVSLRLEECETYTDLYATKLQNAVDDETIPEKADGALIREEAIKARSAVAALAGKAKQSLQMPTYTAYRSSTAQSQWNDALSGSLDTLSVARGNLGQTSRNDFASPLDSLIQTTHPVWLDWLDDLIKAKDDKADDKLLLSRFATDHPGLDHLGGAWRGGTFVLVYDDSEKVIADFALAYPCAEADESEPVEPPLVPPARRRPPLNIKLIKVVRPVHLLVDAAVSGKFESAKQGLVADLKAVQREMESDLEIRTARIDGIIQGASSAREATSPGVVLPGKTIATGNAVLDEMVKDVDYKRQKVQTLVELTSRGDLTEESRSQAQELLAKAQTELGESVAATTEHVVKQNVDTSTGAAAGVASVLANSTVYVTDSTVAASLGSKLESLKTGDVGTSQRVLISNLQNLSRVKR